jgi:hypothetical protein
MSSQKVREVLADCAQRAEEERLSFQDAFLHLDKSSFSILSIILCLPYLQPISLGPLSTLGGLVVAALGWQLAKGHSAPVLPKKLAAMSLSSKVWLQLFKVNEFVLKISNRILKPRLPHLIAHEKGDRLTGILICIGGLLIAVPFVAVPFNNTFPALMVLAACFANLERDGAMVLVSLLFFVVSLCYFAFIGYAALLVGGQAWEWMQSFL